MAVSSINRRPLVIAKPQAQAPESKATEDKSSGSTLGTVASAVGSVAPSAALQTLGAAGAMRAAFTPPLIVDILKSSAKSGLGWTNFAWFIIPSAIRNVRDVVNDKVSVGRGAANVVADTTVGISKGILAGAMVQSLTVIAGPLLAFLPAAVLPFAGIGLALGGLGASYWVLGKLVKGTGVDKKLSNVLTKLFGGDKAPAPAKA